MRTLPYTPTVPTQPRVLKPGRSATGYWTVSFGRVCGSQQVHALVAAAFIGPCPVGQECRHKDDDRLNARADNLEYGTRHQNIMDAVERGRWNRPRGEEHCQAKLTTVEVVEIKQFLAAGALHKDIAAHFSISASAINSIARKRSWAYV